MVLYDLMELKKGPDMLRERSGQEDLEKEKQFFEKNMEILKGECSEEDSIHWRRIQKLG